MFVMDEDSSEEKKSRNLNRSGASESLFLRDRNNCFRKIVYGSAHRPGNMMFFFLSTSFSELTVHLSLPSTCVMGPSLM